MLNAADVEEIAGHYGEIAKKVPLHPIVTEAEYDTAVSVMNALLDQGADDENHPLAGLVATLGKFIGDYDDAHFPLPEIGAAAILRTLMEAHGLKEGDLPEIGTDDAVAEILAGRRDLDVRQIRDLSRRFGLSPAAFF
ncbi:helix-turn-helix domain-containing protein [Methylobacterium sp. JK268]